MTHMIDIDPGKKTGWAVFEGRTLSSAGVSKSEDLFRPTRRDARGEPCGELPEPLFPAETLVLIEMPRWYPRDHKDVNDLLDLAVQVGEIKRFYESQRCTVKLVWPRSWKGNVPKDVTNRRTVAALSPEELARVPVRPRAKTPDHNCLDAIGLGLHELGRLR